MPFEQAPEALAFFAGVVVSAETVRRLTEGAGAALAAVEDAAATCRPPAAAAAAAAAAAVGPAVQQLSADGAMAPLVGGVWAAVKTLVLGTVVPVAPTDDGVVARTVDRSSFSRRTDAERFSQLASVETRRRGTETAGVVCAARSGGDGDGAEWLQSFIDLQRPDAVRILDFPHAAAHLSAAAHAACGHGTLAAREWRGGHLHALKHDDPDQVIVAVAALPVEDAAAPTDAAATRAETVNERTKRRPQVASARFRAAGYPIGSGMVESANNLVVEARLKGSGMQWARSSVPPMVALRAMACRDRWAVGWAALWQHHRDQHRASRDARAARRYAARRSPPRTPLPIIPPAPPPSPARRATPRPLLVVHGRPTAHHPWKRPALAGGRAHNAARAKSCGTPGTAGTGACSFDPVRCHS